MTASCSELNPVASPRIRPPHRGPTASGCRCALRGPEPLGGAPRVCLPVKGRQLELGAEFNRRCFTNPDPDAEVGASPGGVIDAAGAATKGWGRCGYDPLPSGPRLPSTNSRSASFGTAPPATRPSPRGRVRGARRCSCGTQRRPGALLPEHAPKPRGGTVYRDGLPEVQTTESNIRPSALAWSVTSPAARTWPGPPRGGCACALDRLRNRPYGVALGQMTGGSVRGFESGRRHGTNALAIARGARRRAGPGALCRVGAPPGRCCLKMWIASRCVLAPRAGKGTCGRGL